MPVEQAVKRCGGPHHAPAVEVELLSVLSYLHGRRTVNDDRGHLRVQLYLVYVNGSGFSRIGVVEADAADRRLRFGCWWRDDPARAARTNKPASDALWATIR